MLGLESRTVAIVAHDDEWARQFEAEARELTQLLGEAGIQATIQHIGSTAISGLGAKPIIDIAIGVHDEALVGRTLGVMKAAGRDYVKAANQPGMLFMAKGNPRTFHYHLVYLNGRAWDRLVLFRDQLRRHSGVAREYEQLKRDLAERFPDDRLAYAEAKSAFIRAVLNRGFNEHGRRQQARAIARRAQQMPKGPFDLFREVPTELRDHA